MRELTLDGHPRRMIACTLFGTAKPKRCPQLSRRRGRAVRAGKEVARRRNGVTLVSGVLYTERHFRRVKGPDSRQVPDGCRRPASGVTMRFRESIASTPIRTISVRVADRRSEEGKCGGMRR